MGKLFVIDGTDASGKQTQLKKLQERLEKENIEYKLVSFPNYDEGRNYNIDFCGFPVTEKVVLSPEETVANFKAERDRLDAALDEKLDQILQMLGVEL